jgi:hypothetical protein
MVLRDLQKRNFPKDEGIDVLCFNCHIKLHYEEWENARVYASRDKKGSTRSGTDKDGHEWHTFMHFDYGYIRGTVGKDKDHVDCYIGPSPEAETVFIVHQNDPTTGEYDEDKVMLGFETQEAARKAYLSQYDRPDFLGDIDAMDIETFKEKAFDPKNKGKKLRG